MFGWTADESASFAVLDAFVAGGGNAIDTVADRHSALPAQIALAWLMQAPGITAPIASSTSVKQVEELLKATEIQLSAEDVAALQP